MSNWKNLPEGVVTLVASHFDGPRSDVIRALRGVCKPWRADITVAKATMLQGAEAPVWQVLQKTPRLQSLTIVETSVEQSKTLLAEIRIVKHLVPELKSFVFDKCELGNCHMPLSECLGKNTRELTLAYCGLTFCSIENLCDFQHLTSLTVDTADCESNEFDISLWFEIFTNLPSLQFLCLHFLCYHIQNEASSAPNLPNLTSLSITSSDIWYPEFLRGLLRLEHLDLNKTDFSYYDDEFVAYLPVSITTLKICNLDYDQSKILAEGYSRLASRLPLLSSLHVGNDDEVTDNAIEAIASMPSLTRLSVVDCDCVTDTGLANLARSKLERLEIQSCSRVTQEGVDALRAASPSIEIVFDF